MFPLNYNCTGTNFRVFPNRDVSGKTASRMYGAEIFQYGIMSQRTVEIDNTALSDFYGICQHTASAENASFSQRTGFADYRGRVHKRGGTEILI